MKKNLVLASLLFICGISFITILPNGSIFFGMGCGFIGVAIVNFYKYIYRLNPKNKIKYEEYLKNEQNNLNDERKIMLREKSGRITYIVMFIVLTILNIVFTFIGVEKWITITLWVVIAFKYICGVAVFYYLAKKL
ncbi:hypothetical protein KPL47_23510 [Clostridium estertheticum]|uniref:hypothetical protein n=1 Tax=Clostridium estertheticum TaxID=238834 RepID=UPI001C0E3C5A|nr:hypothetical protein [Clostridium estertheticum]MBU3179263.1 hypothetical protein [Clostridium estertheticum]